MMRTLEDSRALLQLRESCGLAYDRQVIRIAWPEGMQSGGCARDRDTGALFPMQRSAVDSRLGFVEVALDPFQTLTLEQAREAASASQSVTFQQTDPGTAVISNGVFSIEVPLGESSGSAPGWDISGSVRRVRVGAGPWRGRTFFDTRRAVKSWRGEILETGPVRAAYRYRAEFAPEGFYEATVTVDRGQPFAVIEEEFHAGAGDQIVWDFSGADLPEEFYLLDSTAGYQTRPLFYYFDQRLTRMICWTQQSQHFDFSDGYAIGFATSSGSREIAGFIALNGGTWRGGKLNHLEAWTRRWFPGDPASRRDVPFEAKADAQPNPDRIPARGHGICEPHFNIEGWIGQGRRKWALVLTSLDKIQPPDPSGEPPGHFEDRPNRELYRAQQSLLRKIHTQRGLVPLQEMLEMEFAWPEEPSEPSPFVYPNDILNRHLPAGQDVTEARRSLMEYLAARVYGFWEGSGSAYTNPVVSRRVAPEMYRYEWLARQGAFSDTDKALVRAQFAFLAHVFASENYYTGDASMLPLESPDSLDPTLAGMANQNFYTDVINISGTAAQVFRNHPRAEQWRTLFIERWHRQLAYHMYPESGVWEESHTYYHHVLHTVLPTFLRRRADGVVDEFANPIFQKLAAGALRQITPRDAFFDGCRHPVIFGDHSVDTERYRYLWHALSEAFLPHHHALAGNLAWAYAEMHGTKPLPVPASMPDLRNDHVQGLGVMFRGIDSAGQETLLALRSGNAWGHHHNDDGSIQFYAKGRAMIVDAAFGTVQADGHRKYEAIGHSRWTLKALEPVNHLWRFNRGWITASALDGPLAFATCYSPVFLVRSPGYPATPLRMPIVHYRSVVQITPAAYLVVDVADRDQDQIVLFHVPGSENVGISAASVMVDFDEECRLHLMPLIPGAAPLAGVDRPKDPDARLYSTTALEYDMGPAHFSAFLISAQRREAPLPEIIQTHDHWDIRGEDFDLSLRRETARQFIVTDRKTPMVRKLTIRSAKK